MISQPVTVGGSLCPFFNHASPNDFDLVVRLVLGVGLDQSHALNHSHATLDPAKDRMLSVQPWGRGKGDEELAAVGVGPAVGHAQNSSTGVLELASNLVLEFLAVDGASSSAGAGGITGLDHEVGDDAVEDDIVIVASLSKDRKVLASLSEIIKRKVSGRSNDTQVGGLRP